MSKQSTQKLRRVKITDKIREAYKKRDKSLNNDPDAPTLPPEMWNNAIIGKYYRPKKTPVTVRIDNDVLEWLRSQGKGHLTRMNEILREQMIAKLKR